MPKVMQCPVCNRRFPSSTYAMFEHVKACTAIGTGERKLCAKVS